MATFQASLRALTATPATLDEIVTELEEDQSRLESLSILFGLGLVLFDLN